MNATTSISTPASKSTPLTPLQHKVVSMLRETTRKIVSDVIITLIESKSMTVNAFIDLHVTKKQASLSSIDQRTQKFSKLLLAVVNEELEQVPSLSPSFAALDAYTHDPQTHQKLVQSVALPSIKKIVADFDKINASIVDDMIGHPFSESFQKRTTVLTSKLKATWRKIPQCQKTSALVACVGLITAYLAWPVQLKITPYDLAYATQIREDLNAIFSETFKPSSYPKNNCINPPPLSSEHTLTNTFKLNLLISKGKSAMELGGLDILNTIDQMIKQQCLFNVFANISDSLERDLRLTLKYNCPMI